LKRKCYWNRIVSCPLLWSVVELSFVIWKAEGVRKLIKMYTFMFSYLLSLT
jgi:hypothetical protein